LIHVCLAVRTAFWHLQLLWPTPSTKRVWHSKKQWKVATVKKNNRTILWEADWWAGWLWLHACWQHQKISPAWVGYRMCV
jgi:hypothetical protein